MFRQLSVLLLLLSALWVATAVAHSGGTNGFGCHNDSRTGLWHCH